MKWEGDDDKGKNVQKFSGMKRTRIQKMQAARETMAAASKKDDDGMHCRSGLDLPLHACHKE